MSLDDERYTLDEPVALGMVTPTGDILRVSMLTVDIGGARVDLTGFVSSDAWQQVVRLGAFHVDLEPGEVPEQAGADVEIVVTLRRPWIDRFDVSDDLFRSLFTEDHVEHVHMLQTEAWLLASAMRELAVPGGDGATTAAGYRTRWAPPLY
jgi:hypothetical protein